MAARDRHPPLGPRRRRLGRPAPCAPDAVAAALADDATRRRFVQVALVLEVCRHPASAAQVQQLDGSRRRARDRRPAARRDPRVGERGRAARIRRLRAPLPDVPARPPTPTSPIPPRDDPSWGEVLPQVAALADLPEGTLGWSYLQFYARHGFPLPGRHTPEPAYYVSHDMNHVIAGYEPTGPGEIALGAFKLAMGDTDANWMAFMANLMIHEAGMIKHGHDEHAQFVPNGAAIYADADGEGALHLPGAADELAEALVRGGQVRGDFSQIDHLAIAHRPLVEIREEYHVVPRTDGHDEAFGV
ncbi:MAG: hypothetical protein U0W40_13565 [Acidimicrobiia bacterium]